MNSFAFAWKTRLCVPVLYLAIYCAVALSREPVVRSGSLPIFSDPLGNVTVTLGRNASLPCSIQNLGDYRVAWIHLERNMVLTVDDTVAARIPRFNLTYEPDRTRWHLHILNVEEEDQGRYMCRLNTDPQMEQVGYLQVVVPPSIIDNLSSPSSVALKEGGTVELKCEAYGKPPPDIYWKREDERPIRINPSFHVQEYRGNSLRIANASKWDMAAYMCIAKNGIQPSVSKRIHLDVFYPPFSNATVAETSVMLGQTALLQCEHHGNPNGKHYWMFNRTSIFDGVRHSISDTTVNHKTTSVLRISGISISDLGWYECIAKNRLGESRASVNLRARNNNNNNRDSGHKRRLDDEALQRYPQSTSRASAKFRTLRSMSSSSAFAVCCLLFVCFAF